MDDIRMVPESLRRNAERNREISEYETGQWRSSGCSCQRTPLPFYMTYPLPMTWEEEDAVMRDLDYLVQMYPTQARRYKEMISRILDTMDYSGSVIYDEYPDRLALFQLSEDIWKRIRQEEAAREAAEGGNQSQGRGEDYWENIKELIQILLYYEIFRRRRNPSAVGYLGAGTGRILPPGGPSVYAGSWSGLPFSGTQTCNVQQPGPAMTTPQPSMQSSRTPAQPSQPPVSQMPTPPMPRSQAPMWQPQPQMLRSQQPPMRPPVQQTMRSSQPVIPQPPSQPQIPAPSAPEAPESMPPSGTDM